MQHDILPGESYPLGATVYRAGVNFSLYASGECEAVELLLFRAPDAPDPDRVIALHPCRNRTFRYWHVFVSNIGAGQVYAWRAFGPCIPELGLRFDPQKVLLDPYGLAVANLESYSRIAASQPGNNCANSLRSVVVDPLAYDWEDDVAPRTPFTRTVIYEVHVGGFTRHPSSGLPEQLRGTYAGLTEKIPYLKQLGVTAVELLPVQHFDPQQAPPGTSNYWGYSPVAFFAPHSAYSSRPEPLGPVDEFRDMVKALHRAGIEVILDVVFNHTAEGNEQGPTLSFRGLANRDYYLLADDLAHYRNYSGCGNTFRANLHAGARLIDDCLRYWVSAMHVDGFRFDLASVLDRGSRGDPLEEPPLLWGIGTDPFLVGAKFIAEPWDADGLYQVGWFSGDRFAEWNGPFRDDVRRFIKGEPGTVSLMAKRLLGSPDIYTRPNQRLCHGINFITCHDGFTLNDLVSYDHKHNEANGEANRDGSDNNSSWNCGEEGLTSHPEVERLRERQVKNFLAALMLSQGTAMLLMGDEVRRSQGGNNNTYCQDSPLSWFDWQSTIEQAGLLRFTTGLIRFTQATHVFQRQHALLEQAACCQPHVMWQGIEPDRPDWSHDSHSLAYTLDYPQQGERVHIIFNAYWQPLDFLLPESGKGCWHLIVDTALPSPEDFSEPELAPPVASKVYRVQERSTVVLLALPNISGCPSKQAVPLEVSDGYR